MFSEFDEVAKKCEVPDVSGGRHPVAIIGAGAIVETGHLPAYRKAGVKVAGLYDMDQERAGRVAAMFELQRVYLTMEELLASKDVSVVDIAVPPFAQPSIASAAMRAGKHVLCQKPLALDEASALQLRELSREMGVKVAVNQQLRFDEGLRAAKAMVDLGWIGQVAYLRFDVDFNTDYDRRPWMHGLRQLELWFHSIHYLDALRWIAGEPRRVYCVGGRTGGQKVLGETRTLSTLVFDQGVFAEVYVNHTNRAGDTRALFRFDGSAGTIKGTLGMVYDESKGKRDTLLVWSEVAGTKGWMPYPVSRSWLPDAFAGPVVSLLNAVDSGGEPETSIDDNIGTVRLIEALYRSMRTGSAMPFGDAGALTGGSAGTAGQ